MEDLSKPFTLENAPNEKNITTNLSALLKKTKKDDSVDLMETTNHPCMISLIEHPELDDYVVLNLSRRDSNGKLIKRTDLVVAGMETRMKNALAAKYPLHLRKTYYAKFGLSPREQFEKLTITNRVVSGPKAIGATDSVFRCSFMPGRNLKDLSPFDSRGQEVNINIAQTTPKHRLMLLWGVLERTHRKVVQLHDKGICLGGLNSRYVVYSNHGQHVYLVNVEKALLRYEVEEDTWQKTCWKDLREILLLALYIQTAVGQMGGQLAYDSIIALDELVGNAEKFFKAIVSKSSHLTR